MLRTLVLVPLLIGSVLLAHIPVRASAAADLLDFYWLRDNILAEPADGRLGNASVDSSDILGTWARWRGTVERVLEPQDGLWLILVEMDPEDVSSASHDLEVWTDDPAAAALVSGQEITVKGTIVDFRRLPGSIIHIVIDARS